MQPATIPLSSLDLTTVHRSRLAIFLDFDGTLAPIVEHPDAVSVPAETRQSLARLFSATDGALAIITGRSIADIDRFLDPLRLPIAGVHGLERRAADGSSRNAPIAQLALDQVSRQLALFVEENAGLLLEPKRGSVALHFRQRPDLAAACLATVDDVLADHPQLQVLPGKMVLEIKAGHETKADAIVAFMTEPPFIGRQPLFAGDDVTDELAFPVIASHDGISIKIGYGDTAAMYRCPGCPEFAGWLECLADHFEGQSKSAQI